MNTLIVYGYGEIKAIVKPGASIGAAISDAKQISNDHFGMPVKFRLNGVPMVIHGETSESNAYWSYMRGLDESLS